MANISTSSVNILDMNFGTVFDGGLVRITCVSSDRLAPVYVPAGAALRQLSK